MVLLQAAGDGAARDRQTRQGGLDALLLVELEVSDEGGGGSDIYRGLGDGPQGRPGEDDGCAEVTVKRPRLEKTLET